jgi:carbamoylphosphate synthase small subunit
VINAYTILDGEASEKLKSLKGKFVRALKSYFSPQKLRKAVLVLEDGSSFFGYGFGAAKKVSGEVVFSTSMVGYPEALTDPSYKGQILTLTYPLIGNYGVPSRELELGVPLYFESESIKVTGLIVHELCQKPCHWTSTKNLDEWLKSENVPGIYGIDTRAIFHYSGFCPHKFYILGNAIL